MKAELVKKTLEKVHNPNILVNILSKRVRQLTSGGGGSHRPMVQENVGMGNADICLQEIIDEKMGWELLEEPPEPQPTGRKKKKSSGR